VAPGLALHESVGRAELLHKERARLLRDVNKKKQRLEQERARAEQEAQTTVTRMAPLVERNARLVSELTALFAELLVQGRLSARAARAVLKVRRSRELGGILAPEAVPSGEVGATPDPGKEPREEPRSEPSRGRRAGAQAGRKRSPRGAARASQPELASARQPDPERRTLREVFRALARAVHPDQARRDTERERRTELMKEVTRAYDAGDLARLIELESAWRSEQVSTVDGDAEARCRELSRVNRELLNQVRRLTRELRDLKSQARETSRGPVERVVARAARQLDELSAMRDFVLGFRDGKLSLAELENASRERPGARGRESSRPR
jgi:hypothetical protein